MANPIAVSYTHLGAALAAWCFSRRLGVIGEYLVSGSMVVFAFATIMAWFYLGRQAAAYFIGGCGFGENAQNMFASKVYPLLFIAAVFLGSEARLGLVWLLSDIWNGLMAFPNLTALLFLSREVTCLLYTSSMITDRSWAAVSWLASMVRRPAPNREVESVLGVVTSPNAAIWAFA